MGLGRSSPLLCLLFLLCSLARLVRGICPDLCVCNDDALVVTCIKAGLDTMPNTLNPGLQTIVYKYNEFPTIHFSLTFLPALIKVDLSHNKIVTISNKAFERQSELKQLKLESNKISQITNQTFYGLTKLKVLVLRGNLVEKLPEGLFGYSTQLEEIDLGRNRLSSIHESAFEGLSSLQILNLEDNELSSIPSEALRKVPDLAELHLAGNPLKTISDRALSFFQRLTILDLSASRLRVLENSAFSGLGTLRQLKLADNNFSSVPAESFKHIPNLEVLDIGRNPFQVITRGSFRYLSKLKKFDLSGCGRLESIESQAFVNCVDLEHVTISLNRHLTSIAGDAFDVMPNLRFLSLADNALQRLRESLVAWKVLRALDVAGNPWSCDCDLVFLPEVIRALLHQTLTAGQTTTTDNGLQEAPLAAAAVHARLISDGKCASPPALRLRALSEVRNLDCLSNVRQEPQGSGNGGRSEGNVLEAAASSPVSPVSSTVIISVSVSLVIVVILSVLLLLAYRSRHRMQDWIKALRWHQHDQAIARKGVQDPCLRQHEYRQPSYSCDDEHYYYVTTMQNRLAAGKHIPVTEL